MSFEERSIADLYRHHHGYSQFDQEHRAGGAYGLHFIDAQQRAHDFTDPAFDELVIVQSLKSDMPFRWNLGDGWSDEKRMRTGGMNICPVDTQIEYNCGDEHRLLIVSCPRNSVDGLLQEYGIASRSTLDPLHSQAIVHDAFVAQALRDIWRATESYSGAVSMLVDGMWQAVVARLLKRADIEAKPEGKMLTGTELNRVQDYVDQQLGEAIGIQHLAGIVGMPLAQFTGGFQKAMGLTPHQYVLSRRISRAQELLAEGDMPLAEIAYACGFASQSHMTDVFRQKLGVTPGRYRKEVKG